MANMTVTHFLELSRQLVKNQIQMVNDQGYCMSWCGFSVHHFASVEQYKSVIKDDLLEWIKQGEIQQDVDDVNATVDKFLRELE